MGDQLLLRKKKDPVPFLVYPDGMINLLRGGIGDQEKGSELIEIAQPVKANSSLRFPPLFKKNGLIDACERQMVVGHHLPRSGLPRV